MYVVFHSIGGSRTLYREHDGQKRKFSRERMRNGITVGRRENAWKKKGEEMRETGVGVCEWKRWYRKTLKANWMLVGKKFKRNIPQLKSLQLSYLHVHCRANSQWAKHEI